MSREMETLDQLLGGEMPALVIRGLFADDDGFAQAVHGLLRNGDVILLGQDGKEVPRWRWRELFSEGLVVNEISKLRLAPTPQGVRRTT